MSGRRQLNAIRKMSGGPLIWLVTNIYKMVAFPFQKNGGSPTPETASVRAMRTTVQVVVAVVLIAGVMWLALELAL